MQKALRQAADDVWWTKEEAENLRLFLNEETITETTLLQLARACSQRRMRITPYTKQVEKKLGADWEWCFHLWGRALSFRVQAKRIYRDGRYASLTLNGAQTQSLIAKSGRSYPLFVFYNDFPSVLTGLKSKHLEPGCANTPFISTSSWGCAVASAYSIKAAKRKHFGALQDIMMPWHCLLCDASCRLKLPGKSPLDKMATRLNLSLASDDMPKCEVTGIPSWVHRLNDPQVRQYIDAQQDGFPTFHPREVIPELDFYLDEHDLSGVISFELGG